MRRWDSGEGLRREARGSEMWFKATGGRHRWPVLLDGTNIAPRWAHASGAQSCRER